MMPKYSRWPPTCLDRSSSTSTPQSSGPSLCPRPGNLKHARQPPLACGTEVRLSHLTSVGRRLVLARTSERVTCSGTTSIHEALYVRALPLCFQPLHKGLLTQVLEDLNRNLSFVPFQNLDDVEAEL